MGANLKDIARELNVSVSTVSRVVNGTGRISPETRKKVLKALKQYNYTPNRIARSLRSKNSKIVGLIVPDIGEYFANVIKGAEEILTNNGYTMILVDSQEDKKREADLIQVLANSQIGGLMVATVSDTCEWLEEFNSNNIPVVFFDNAPNTDLAANMVLLDNRRAVEMAVDYLAELGHKDIAFVCGNIMETTARERFEGFVSAMKKNNLKINEELIKQENYQKNAGYESMMSLIAQRKKHYFSAVVSSTYRISCSIIHAIREMGLEFPEDVSFVGFDMQDDDKLYNPPITSVIQPSYLIGQMVANQLINCMNDIEKENANHVADVSHITTLKPDFVIGESSKVI